jgi:hypothetical protein
MQVTQITKGSATTACVPIIIGTTAVAHHNVKPQKYVVRVVVHCGLSDLHSKAYSENPRM